MPNVLETSPGVFEPITGNPELVSLDGNRRAPLLTILHDSWTAAQRAAFGVFKVAAAAVPAGHRIVSVTYQRQSGNNIIQVLTTEEIIPAAVTQLQIRRILRNHPQAAAIRAYFQGLTDEQKEDWQFAARVRRDNPLILGLQAHLGATNNQVDALFKAAAAAADD